MSLNRMVGGFFGKPNTIEQKAKQSTSPITLRFLTEMVYVNPPASLEVSSSIFFSLTPVG